MQSRNRLFELLEKHGVKFENTTSDYCQLDDYENEFYTLRNHAMTIVFTSAHEIDKQIYFERKKSKHSKKTDAIAMIDVSKLNNFVIGYVKHKRGV